jgi:hypothetical protein
MATTNKVMVGIDDQVIELTGADKEAFLADRKANADAQLLLEADYEAKRTARANAINKLGQASGLTETEIEAILNG